jgi:hypothetical protein
MSKIPVKTLAVMILVGAALCTLVYYSPAFLSPKEPRAPRCRTCRRAALPSPPS